MRYRGPLEPIGYIYRGGIYCFDCIGDELRDAKEVSAMFDDAQSDVPEHCGECHDFLGGGLTNDGFKRLVEEIRSFRFEFWLDYLEEYMDAWDHFDWHVIPTFAGMMDPFGNLKLRW